MKDLTPGVEEEEARLFLAAAGEGEVSLLLLSSFMLRRLRMAASEEGRVEGSKEGREAAARTAGVLVVPDVLPMPFLASVASNAPREERLRRACWYICVCVRCCVWMRCLVLVDSLPPLTDLAAVVAPAVQGMGFPLVGEVAGGQLQVVDDGEACGGVEWWEGVGG